MEDRENEVIITSKIKRFFLKKTLESNMQDNCHIQVLQEFSQMVRCMNISSNDPEDNADSRECYFLILHSSRNTWH